MEKNKILKNITIILFIILIIESIYFGNKLINYRKNTTYYTTIESIEKDNDNYVTVGMSDYKNSKMTNYKKPGYNKPTIQIYNNNNEVINEKGLDIGYNGLFRDVAIFDDCYIAVGEISMSQEQNNDSLTEGVIAKFDKDLKLIWRKNIQILDNTKLYAVSRDGNDIVVVGQSLYGANYIGNHKTGGAIIIKYDQDGNELMRSNLGGPTTGTFNDLVVTDDGYVVVGVMSKSTGIVVKYDKNLNKKWHNYYGHTDQKGLTSIATSGDHFIVTGSKLNEEGNTDNYKAVLLEYDKNGKQINELKWQEKNISRFEKTLVTDNKILVLAIYGNKEGNTLINNAYILEIDNNFKITNKTNLEGKKIVTFKDIKLDNDSYIVVGYTNSKIKGIKTNGYDYYPIIVKYDKNLKIK